MHRSAPCVLVLVAAVAFAGCGDDDAVMGPSGEPASTTPPETEPVASVPAPDETMPARCATEGRDFNGVTSFSAEGVDCEEAKSVYLNWLQGCGGQEGSCEPAPGYSCEQERFAGARSDVVCVKGAATVKFSFG